MRSLPFLLTVSMAIALAGCALRGKPPAAKATPVAAVPVVTPAPPPPPPAPLSIPQTTVELPAPQPVTPEALASTLPPDEPALPASTPPRAPRPKPAAPKPAEPQVTPPPAQPVETERPTIQEVLPADQQRRFQQEADDFRREIRQRVEQAEKRQLNYRQRNLLNRIRSFEKQSADAQVRGDMRQARELAGRALVLARELQP